MISIVAKGNVTAREKRNYKIIAITAALVVLSIFFLLLGKNPFMVYFYLVEGSIGSGYRVLSTLKYVVPLFLSALAVTFAFKLKFWNIGVEGQIVMGAVFSTFFAINFQDLSRPILLILMLIAGIIGGGLYGMLSAAIKVFLKTDETIITLMLNYVSVYFLTYLQYDLWKDPDSLGFPKIQTFSENATLPNLFGLHIGWVIAIIVGVIVYFIFRDTKLGYQISVVGESPKTAIYAGIQPVKLILLTLFISGGLGGMVGMIQSSGVMKTLSLEITMGVGYTGIIIAWLGELKPSKVAVVSLLFGMLTQGGYFLQSSQGIPASAIGVFQASLLFFVLASEFFTRYKFVRVNHGGESA